MDWIQIIANYSLAGLVITFLLDKANSNNPDPEMNFTNRDRLVVFTTWPIALLVFIYYFFKSMK